MIYNLLLLVIYPFLIIYSAFNKKMRVFLKKRLFQKINIKGEYIWFHMASVGEVNLSESIINKFLLESKYKVLLTVLTDTGYKIAKDKYGDKIDIYYFPIDNLFVIKRILSKINLKKLILVETEIWPNLINEAYKYCSVSIINGRISDKSFKSYMKLRFVMKKLFEKITFFIMQTELDAKRIIDLGAKEKRVFNFGNLKFDIQLQTYSNEELQEIKNDFGIKEEKIFVAGSTREGEEKLIIKVFEKLKGYKLFLVPRHLERLEEIKEELKEKKYTTWSEKGKNSQIILVDKIGILRKLYAFSDVAFVGGTLVNIGGHSLLEPLFYMKFPIFGQYTQNVRDISKEIIKREIGYRVTSIEEFLGAIKKIEKNINDNNEIIKFFKENKNVCDKTYDLIIDAI